MGIMKNIYMNMQVDAKNTKKNLKEKGLIKTLILDHEVSKERSKSIGIIHPLDFLIKFFKNNKS